MTKRKGSSTNSVNRRVLNEACGMLYAIDIIGGRWKLMILYKLEEQPKRFSELKQLIPNITDRMLTLHLQELERDGLLVRTVYAQVPPRVDYQLSESGQRLTPIWKALKHWGLDHKNFLDSVAQPVDLATD
ncbi:winged helix-turn-helix transcriptional regulator [Spirosoma arcticum]